MGQDASSLAAAPQELPYTTYYAPSVARADARPRSTKSGGRSISGASSSRRTPSTSSSSASVSSTSSSSHSASPQPKPKPKPTRRQRLAAEAAAREREARSHRHPADALAPPRARGFEETAQSQIAWMVGGGAVVKVAEEEEEEKVGVVCEAMIGKGEGERDPIREDPIAPSSAPILQKRNSSLLPVDPANLFPLPSTASPDLAAGKSRSSEDHRSRRGRRKHTLRPLSQPLPTVPEDEDAIPPLPSPQSSLFDASTISDAAPSPGPLYSSLPNVNIET